MNIKVGRYSIPLSNQDKILFGDSGITKGEMVQYYDYIAPIMLPHVTGRAVSMHRFPEGIAKEGFFQKQANDYFPDWVTTVAVKHSEGIVNYVVIDKAATIVYVANQGCITPHLWLSRSDKIEKPDRIIFDLDPVDEHSFKEVQYVAQKIKKVLDFLQLPSFFMLTGSRGAHIVVPIKRRYTFPETREFAHTVATYIAQQDPKHITVDMQKSKRGKRVFIDWLRNGFGATAVAPYAVRAKEGAPVAMPVTWSELCKKGMTSQKYTIKNVPKRINTVGDVWAGIEKHAVLLTRARQLLHILLDS